MSSDDEAREPEPESDQPESDQPESDQPESDAPPPLDKKIPEPPGNLRRRQDWFRKRSE
jgi:hypothetical protein